MKPGYQHDIGKRFTKALLWRSTSTISVLLIELIRAILLARLLPVEIFGIYAFASTAIRFGSIFPRFGTNSVLLYTSNELADKNTAAAAHFTLRTFLTTLWVLLTTALTLLFTSGVLQIAMLVLIATQMGLQLADTARILLVRHIAHRRLAIIAVLNTLISTPIAILLAWQGSSIWALLAIDLVSCTLTLFVLYLWRPLWRPRFIWAPAVIWHFIRIGIRHMTTELFQQGMRSLDKLWIGIMMGPTPLGLYSRGSVFGFTPNRILIQPVIAVSSGVFSELSNKQVLFSRSASLIISLIVRVGSLVAGCLLVIAPEIILLLIGEKWLPMQNVFMTMLIAGIFLSVNQIVEQLYMAKGNSGKLIKIRGLQLILFLIGLSFLIPWAGITGAAFAFLFSNIIGVLILLPEATNQERQSITGHFLAPGLSMAAGYFITGFLNTWIVDSSSLIMIIIINLIIFITVFAILSMLFEWRLCKDLYQFIARHVSNVI